MDDMLYKNYIQNIVLRHTQQYHSWLLHRLSCQRGALRL